MILVVIHSFLFHLHSPPIADTLTFCNARGVFAVPIIQGSVLVALEHSATDTHDFDLIPGIDCVESPRETDTLQNSPDSSML